MLWEKKDIVREIPISLMVLLLLFTSCVIEEDNFDTWEDEYGLRTVIWNKSPHCAFTDMIEYKRKLYCCFREAESHLSYDGRICVIVSDDGVKWDVLGTLKDPEFDLRDPKLLVRYDGQLILHYGRRNIDKSNHNWNCIKIISEGELADGCLEETNIFEINIDDDSILSGYWIWKPKSINGVIYGIAYKSNQFPLLVKSLDGINYTVVKTLEVYGNEADIESIDEKFVIVMRAYEGNGYIGYSTNMDLSEKMVWTSSNVFIQSPCISLINGYPVIAGRSNIGTSLFILREQMLLPLIEFECYGDYAYPGIAVLNNDVYISYYTTIEGLVKVIIRKIPLADIMSLIEKVNR